MLLFLEERPSDVKSKGATEATVGSGPKNDPRNSALENFLLTGSNPSLWLLGISLGLGVTQRLSLGFPDWGLTHLKEVQDTGVGKAALKYAVLPLGAIAGSYLAGWVTDRFFGSRRAPVTCLLLVALALLSLAYEPVARAGYQNPDQAADFAVDLDNQVIADFTDVRLAVHLCRRARGPSAR